jgi:hypothetical protein
VPELVKGIVQDIERMVSQHFDMFRSELRQEFDQAKTAALEMGSGAALVAAGGLLGTQMLVHALHAATRLPLWSCYCLVGGAMAAAGVGLVRSGTKQVADVGLMPQTRATLKEDASWLKEQVTRAGA